MTAKSKSLTGAASATLLDWSAINWKLVQKHVYRLQMRIAKAKRENRPGKVKALQWILTHSLYAKVFAVRQVTQNQGRNTPGVDNILWKTTKVKANAAISLKRQGYKAQPLRRINIPKKNGKKRPLGIPTMKDRAMQALYLYALEPIAETTADKNSYGFRPKRSTADAIQQCFILFSRKHNAEWILEADIKACFDKINHQWLLNNIPMDKVILKQWLSSGYVENQTLMPTREGTPQGGIISPTLANMKLDGLENAIKAIAKRSDRINVVRYADDFIVSCFSKEILESKVKPIIGSFLEDRGLSLSKEKTKITHIEEGFNFLGFNIRKYLKGRKLLIKPAKDNIKSILKDIRKTISHNKAASTEQLIRLLNPKLRGWAYYYRHTVAKDTFSLIDHRTYQTLYRWIRKRHPNKNWKWCKNKYFRSKGLRNWIFSTQVYSKTAGYKDHLDLFNMGHLAIIRHRKIRAEANHFDPIFKEYFEQRKLPSMKCSPYHWIERMQPELSNFKMYLPN
ncbi:group II intron reverse transcriptase/maturase [Legionella gresilensis]|uniref:group II intron reverse transcriptase/maturase n=1 Tax=Legionella gresilensis TaxID=91823 RepID=UPI0010416245|nr:group II intron reverse transcriptase/maturase [Legionella gresilensis]